MSGEVLKYRNGFFIRRGYETRHTDTSQFALTTPISAIQRPLIDMVDSVLKRGVKKGVIRDDVDIVQLNITIAAVSYYYLTNRHTGSIIYKRDFTREKMLNDRLAFNLDTIRRLLMNF